MIGRISVIPSCSRLINSDRQRLKTNSIYKAIAQRYNDFVSGTKEATEISTEPGHLSISKLMINHRSYALTKA